MRRDPLRLKKSHFDLFDCLNISRREASEYYA